jgi:hypothetical protein
MPGIKEPKKIPLAHQTVGDSSDIFNEMDAWLTAFPTTTEFFRFFAKKLKYFERQNEKSVRKLET